MSTGTTFALLLGLLFVTGILGYPSRERLMPDGAPVPEDTADQEDSVAEASEVGGEEYDDDSDMYMEPDGAETSQQGQVEEAESHRVSSSRDSRNDDAAIAIIDETELTPKAEERSSISEKSIETESQNFFPSFAQIFANHRLQFDDKQQPQQQQQQHYRPNRFLGYFQRDRGAFENPSAGLDQSPHPLLGSGNFGVIRGGTYYSDEKDKDEYTVGETLYNPYFHGLNSRAKDNYYVNPKPQPVRGGDFFANFRDFADITAPPKSSFSHLSIVYANKNGTSGRITEPRNIIETLRMLEEESATETSEIPRKKLSSGKRKLMKMKKYQEDKARKSRMTIEPLLALS